MIHVKQDESIIPKEVIKKAKMATADLERFSPEDRKDYIKKKGQIWRDFAPYLSQMSHGKCWYSESNDPQSFFDIDHFRPKLKSKRSEKQKNDSGYEWLAFNWRNFRYSAICSNRLSTNADTNKIDGKGSWFPLMADSPKSTWSQRVTRLEKAVLLDPVKKSDIVLIEAKLDGRMGPVSKINKLNKYRVDESCKCYGLNLPRIISARLRLIREIDELLDVLGDLLEISEEVSPCISKKLSNSIIKLREILYEKMQPKSPYSTTAIARIKASEFSAIIL